MTKLYEKYGLSSVSERAAVFERYQLAGQPELKACYIAAVDRRGQEAGGLVGGLYKPGSLAAHIHQNHRDMDPQKFDEVVLEWYVAALSQSQPNFKRSDLYIAMMADVYRLKNMQDKIANVPRMIDGLASRSKPGAEEQVWAATMTKLYEKYGLSSVSERAAVFEQFRLAGQPGLRAICIAKAPWP
jgi:hypothetical protein